jgi:HAD superfamily hydrolase (TIGR01549 family)
VLREAGIKCRQEVIFKLLREMQQSRMDLVLYDDVAPVLDELKSQGLILGLISNIEQDMTEIFSRLKLPAWLTVLVTSQDAGAGKPRPEIFRYALERAGVKPAEALYIGDQYQVDVVGARGAGMKAILLDRGDYYKDITDCPRIRSLAEVVGHL